MEQAGLPRPQAFKLLADHSPNDHYQLFQKASDNLNSGNSLAETGCRIGLWTTWEAGIVSAGETSGKLEHSFRQLHALYSLQASQWRKLRSRLVYPVAVWLIGIFVLPLPALVNNEISAGAYFVAVLSNLLVLLALIVAVIWLTKRWQCNKLPKQIYQVVLTFPYFGETYRVQILRYISWSLWIQLTAGIDAHMALKQIRENGQSILEEQINNAIHSVSAGQSLLSALADNDLLVNEDSRQLLLAGEASGSIDTTLEKIINNHDEWLQSRYDQIGGWLPWLIYGLLFASLLG